MPKPWCAVFRGGAIGDSLIASSPIAQLAKTHNVEMICAEHGFPQWAAQSLIVRGRVRGALEGARDAIAEMERGFADWRALGGKLVTTRFSVWLAEACPEAGHIAAGLDWIKAAAEHVRAHDERDHEAEMHRVHGELLLARAPTGDAEDCLRRSIEIARRQKAKSFELRVDVAAVGEDIRVGIEFVEMGRAGLLVVAGQPRPDRTRQCG